MDEHEDHDGAEELGTKQEDDSAEGDRDDNFLGRRLHGEERDHGEDDKEQECLVLDPRCIVVPITEVLAADEHGEGGNQEEGDDRGGACLGHLGS